MATELFDLRGLDFDLNLTGFEVGEIDSYLASLEGFAGLIDEDSAPAIPDKVLVSWEMQGVNSAPIRRDHLWRRNPPM